MTRPDLRLPGAWLIGLVLFLALAQPIQVWGQPGGMGRGGMMGGGGMGGPGDGDGPPGAGHGQKRQGPPKFDLNKATTITGKVESLGSYVQSSWRSMSGLAVQGLILKTSQGNIEVYLGPPSYVSQQSFPLMKGDTLEVHGFQVLHGGKPAFFAAKVKNNNRTLSLLDEQGKPLWKQQEGGSRGSERAGRGRGGPGQMGGGMTGGSGGFGR